MLLGRRDQSSSRLMSSMLGTHRSFPLKTLDPDFLGRRSAPALLLATTMLPRRSRMSGREVASASTAMISLLTVMSKPVSRVMPCRVSERGERWFCGFLATYGQCRRCRASPSTSSASVPSVALHVPVCARTAAHVTIIMWRVREVAAVIIIVLSRACSCHVQALCLTLCRTWQILCEQRMSGPAFSFGPCPTVMERRKRSFVSSTRRQVMVAGSMSSRANLRPHGKPPAAITLPGTVRPCIVGSSLPDNVEPPKSSPVSTPSWHQPWQVRPPSTRMH